MGLRQRLGIVAVGATHALVVETPGGWRTRVAIEHEVGRRGWRLALSPADADAVVVAGTPGSQLAERVEAVWNQLPGPRARTVVAGHADVAGVREALDSVSAELLDSDRQARDARDRAGVDSDRPSDDAEGGAEMDMSSGDAEMDMAGDSADGEMDMSGGDGEMDMDMEMAPSGIPLAEGGEDRDGLEMDVLHLPLGPVLPHWPAGVVLRCTLQGDVVVEADASLLDESDWASERLTPNERAAWWCDHVASLLALAGWADGREAALRARDALLDEPDAASGVALIDDLQRRLRRARLLRWALRGIGELRPENEPDAPPHLHGDVYERLLKLTDRARAELTDDAVLTASASQPRLPVLLAVAERLVVGLDLAAARLVVASLAIDAVSPPVPAIRGPVDGQDGHHD